MYTKYKGGETMEVQGLTMHLPPVGYGVREERLANGSHLYHLEQTDIIQRSKKEKDQYWEREPLPDWYISRREEEEIMQENSPAYFDERCEAYRQKDWGRRLRGVWIWINGRQVYITGLHYFYMQWWQIDIGYPMYRECDRLFFYFLQYCIEDPACLGMLNVAKRKSGKTARSGVFLYEYISRNSKVHGGIQSKTDPDAAEVFAKAIVQPWRELPHFYRPIFDTLAGDNPDKEVKFFQTSQKGKNAGNKVETRQFSWKGLPGINTLAQLKSWIDFKARGATAYDGPHLHRYVSDECGKLRDVDINKRHGVVRFCSFVNGKYIGKHLYTTTVEEIEDGGGRFKKLWDNSDHTKGGRTQSGLYRYFEPAYTIDEVDKYGYTNEEANKARHLEERELSRGDQAEYFGVIRRNAFTIEEAFKFSNQVGMYDTERLYDRIDVLETYTGMMEKGNLVWEGGIPDTRVIWEKNKNGRWTRCWDFPQDKSSPLFSNNVIKRGSRFIPNASTQFIMAVDPFSHSNTQDSRKSFGAALIKRKHDPFMEKDPFDDAFVCLYHSRPATVTIFHEDMLKTAVYFGCLLLLENNKNALIEYFKLRNYEAFLLKLPEYNEYGMPGNDKTAERIVDVTEEYQNKCMEKIFYPALLRQWIDFDFKNRTPFDLAMAAGYCLIADHKLTYKYSDKKPMALESVFKTHKIAV